MSLNHKQEYANECHYSSQVQLVCEYTEVKIQHRGLEKVEVQCSILTGFSIFNLIRRVTLNVLR
jgi:hypothetical protein